MTTDNKALADRLRKIANDSVISTSIRQACAEAEAKLAALSPQADKARGEAPGFIRESLAALPPDDFRNDNFHLVACIEALLSLDKAGALVPHGVSGHARRLLASAAHRLAATTTPQSQGDASPAGWREVIDRARDGLGAAGGFGVAGSIQRELEITIGGALLDHIEDELAALSTPQARHPDDEAVDRFAVEMKKKLADARAKGRGGWDGSEDLQQRLSDMLRDHVAKGDPRDVANFACFLWNRGENIAPAEPAPTVDGGVRS